jgi:hypothetical protein
VIDFLELLEKKMKYTWHTVFVSLLCRGKGMDAEKVLSAFKGFDVSFSSVQVSGDAEKKSCVMEFRLKRFRPIHLDKVLETIRGWDGVENITVKREDK